jgi:hypothetical protein
MPVAQSPAHYINSCKGCPSITESFPLRFLLVLCATVAALLSVVEPHYPLVFVCLVTLPSSPLAQRRRVCTLSSACTARTQCVVKDGCGIK